MPLWNGLNRRAGGFEAGKDKKSFYPVHCLNALDLAVDVESSWRLEPPGFRVRAWDEVNNGQVTQLAAWRQFEGPYPFHENGALIGWR